MAELVRRRTAVEEAEVHRRLVDRDALRVGADVAPGSVVVVEGDADLGRGSVVEHELQVGVGRPPCGLLLHLLLLLRASTHEAHMQGGAVDPGLADRR
jgi:hypothetical protein